MSTNNYILNLLNIKDENIHIITKCKEKIIKGNNYKIIEGILTYTPKYCPCCGVVNQSTNDIINNVFIVNTVTILLLLKPILLIKIKIFLIILIFK